MNDPHPTGPSDSHPQMDPGVAAGARHGDQPAGDTYRGAGLYEATPGNIGLYAAIGVGLLLFAGAMVWMFFG